MIHFGFWDFRQRRISPRHKALASPSAALWRIRLSRFWIESKIKNLKSKIGRRLPIFGAGPLRIQ